MYRYFIEIAYRGENYAGFQVQKNAVSVQQKLDEALSQALINTPVKTTGASRTDTGVHARQNFVHFDREHLVPDNLAGRLNKILPPDILVKRIFPVSQKAHARFDAVSRSYEYVISFRKNPFMNGLAHFYYGLGPLDVVRMNEAAKALREFEDFSAFSKGGTQVKTNLCRIREARWEYYEDMAQIIFYITANRFLRGMVRGITGTLLRVGLGSLSVEDFREITRSKSRKQVDFSPPPYGLYLTRIEYPFRLPRVEE